MANNREIAQLGSFISVHDTTGKVGVANSVGIGTTSPTADWTVDVHGDARVSGILSVSQIDSTGSIVASDIVARNIKATGISTFEGNTNIGVGGTTLVGITTNSRVGINSTSPNYNLDVVGIINSSTDVRINGSSVIDEAVAMAIALG
tara:strand:+ start:242 stop:685 length:444 start_codon:yes stop_codon:yes gene_type:complete